MGKTHLPDLFGPPGGDFPCCAVDTKAADPEAEAEAEAEAFALLFVLGLVLADMLAHPGGAAEVIRSLEAADPGPGGWVDRAPTPDHPARPLEAEARRWHGNLRDRRSEDA